MTIPVTVMVLTKNEEANLGRTLAHLRQFDDVIVIDSCSSDRTREIAEDFGARVVEFSWDGTYPKKKQWSLDNAGGNHEWVMLLDADEYPSAELLNEIERLSSDGSRDAYGAYDVTLLYRFAGTLLHHGHRVVKRSLINRTLTRFPEVGDLEAPGIREVEGHYQPQTTKGIGRLSGQLVHDDRDPVRTWFDRHNRYSDWEAYLNTDRVTKRRIASLRSNKGRIFDSVPFKPVLFFLYAYLVKRGFRDGRAGFDYAFALSHYYWQIGLKTREVLRSEPETPSSPSDGDDSRP